MRGWITEATEAGVIRAQLIQSTKQTPLLNGVQHNALELTIKATPQDPVCLVNKGFWGINAVQGRTYRLSFWAKAPKYKGGVLAMLRNEAGDEKLAQAQISLDPKAKGWTKYEAVLQSEGNDAKAQFALVFDGVGVVDLDVVSLFPPTFKNRENGMRPDLANMLWQMHPKFMRFPGGCFVEDRIHPTMLSAGNAPLVPSKSVKDTGM